MRKTLIATSALAFAGALAAAPASAADKLSVGVGGYMQQWIGVSDLDNNAAGDGGVSQYSDSEIFIRGNLEADNGLSFSVKVEFEGNTHADVVDESQVTVSGGFGQLVLGSEDDPTTIMHYGTGDVGVGLNCGDASFIDGLTSCARSNGKGLGTAGHLIGGDSQKIVYYTPRISGVQLGASYSPESVEDSGAGSPVDNDNDAWSVGLNLRQEFGGNSVAVSLGHYQRSMVGESTPLMSGMNDDKITVGKYTANNADIRAYADAMDDGTADDLGDLAVAAHEAETSNGDAFDTMASKADDETFTNFGLRVGMGAFGFSVAYATHDGGTYEVANRPIVKTVENHTWDHDDNDQTINDEETADNNDPSNDTARTVLVKDTSRDYDVMSAGVTYSDGPMGVSLSHMAADADDGTEASATMLSMSYTLAPGIASRSSLIFGEQDEVEGTAFVTGITLNF